MKRQGSSSQPVLPFFSRISAVTVTGVFNTADIFADATASVQVSGVTEKATVMATGAASVGVVTTTAGESNSLHAFVAPGFSY